MDAVNSTVHGKVNGYLGSGDGIIFYIRGKFYKFEKGAEVSND